MLTSTRGHTHSRNYDNTVNVSENAINLDSPVNANLELSRNLDINLEIGHRVNAKSNINLGFKVD